MDNQSSTPIYEWTLDLFKPEDAAGMVEIYTEIYGRDFPLSSVYDPQWHIQQREDHISYTVVARLPNGKIAGCISLYPSVDTNKKLFELGAVMVSKNYRFDSLPPALCRYQIQTIAPQFNIADIWGETVCNHRVTQMVAIKLGFVYCGLEVDMMPAEAYSNLTERGQNTNSCVSCGVVFRTTRTAPKKIYLPQRYAAVLKTIYAQITASSEFFECEKNSLPYREKTLVSVEKNSHFCRTTVLEIGQDFEVLVQNQQAELLQQKVDVSQVIIPLTFDNTEFAVDMLQKKGYWFGGVMPCWFEHTDGLLLQRINYTPNFENILIYSKMGEFVFNAVREDFEKISQSQIQSLR